MKIETLILLNNVIKCIIKTYHVCKYLVDICFRSYVGMTVPHRKRSCSQCDLELSDGTRVPKLTI